MRHEDGSVRRTDESAKMVGGKPFERPVLERLGTLARVVKQSGPVTMSGGRT